MSLLPVLSSFARAIEKELSLGFVRLEAFSLDLDGTSYSQSRCQESRVSIRSSRRRARARFVLRQTTPSSKLPMPKPPTLRAEQ